MATMQLSLDPIRTLLASQTVAATVTSTVVDYSMFTTIGIIVKVSSSSSIVGSVKIEVSLDGVTWGEYSGSSVAVTADGVIPYNISDFAFCQLRVVFTRTSGSAVVEIKAVAKQG